MSESSYKRFKAASKTPAGKALSRRAREMGRRVTSAYVARGMLPAPRAQPRVYRSSGELKGCDIAIGFQITDPIPQTTNTNTGACVLNCVQMGAGSWNRVGRKIYMKSLRLRGEVEAILGNSGTPASVITSGCVVRLVVVYDRQPSGNAIPTFNAVFGHTSQDGNEVSLTNDGLRYDNMGRFRVLRDKYLVFNPSSIPRTAEFGEVQKAMFDEFIDLKGLETVYSGQSAPMTIADISTGALYLYARQDLVTTGVSISRVDTNSVGRLRYTD